MNRKRLIWFAIGAAVTSAAAVIGFLIHQGSIRQAQWKLVVWGERRSSVQLANVHPLMRLAMSCEAKMVNADVGYSEHDIIDIPLSAENQRPVNCLIKRATDENLYFEILLEKSK